MTSNVDTIDENYIGYKYGTNSEYALSFFFTLFILLLMLSILFGNRLVHHWHLYFMPEAGTTMIVGMLAGGVCLLQSDAVSNSLIHFDPDIFFVALLPPIIFNSGYTMKRRFFFENITSVLSFAIVGTFISTMSIGIGLYIVGYCGFSLNLSMAECLAFGALISSTDPVSILAVFQEFHVDPLLFYLVFGESLLNDAIAIVLYETFSKFIGYSHSIHSVPIAFIDFFLIFFGSTLLGVFVGACCSLLFKYFNFKGQLYQEISVYLMFCYLPFLLAEIVEMSGIVAVLFAGVILKHYAHNNLTVDARTSCIKIFQVLANLSETAIFLNLGLSVLALPVSYNISFICWGIFFCLIGRALSIYPISFLLNKKRKEPIPKNIQHMLWFSGLRGAMAFSLSLSFTGSHRNDIVSTTMVIVLLTVFLMGTATEKMLKCLKIKQLTPEEERELDLHVRPAKKMKVLRWDEVYLMPFFTSTSTTERIYKTNASTTVVAAEEETEIGNYIDNIKNENDLNSNEYSIQDKKINNRIQSI